MVLNTLAPAQIDMRPNQKLMPSHADGLYRNHRIEQALRIAAGKSAFWNSADDERHTPPRQELAQRDRAWDRWIKYHNKPHPDHRGAADRSIISAPEGFSSLTQDFHTRLILRESAGKDRHQRYSPKYAPFEQIGLCHSFLGEHLLSACSRWPNNGHKPGLSIAVYGIRDSLRRADIYQ